MNVCGMNIEYTEKVVAKKRKDFSIRWDHKKASVTNILVQPIQPENSILNSNYSDIFILTEIERLKYLKLNLQLNDCSFRLPYYADRDSLPPMHYHRLS